MIEEIYQRQYKRQRDSAAIFSSLWQQWSFSYRLHCRDVLHDRNTGQEITEETINNEIWVKGFKVEEDVISYPSTSWGKGPRSETKYVTGCLEPYVKNTAITEKRWKLFKAILEPVIFNATLKIKANKRQKKETRNMSYIPIVVLIRPIKFAKSPDWVISWTCREWIWFFCRWTVTYMYVLIYTTTVTLKQTTDN